MLTSTLTSKGQFTLPASLRKKLGLKPSDRVAFTKHKGRVYLEKLPSIGQLFGSLKNTQVLPLSTNKMNKLIEEGLFKK